MGCLAKQARARRLIGLALLLYATLGGPGPAGPVASAQTGAAIRTVPELEASFPERSSPRRLDLFAGESTLLQIPGLIRVAVGNPAVADVKLVSEDELLVNAKASGATTLILWTGGGTRLLELEVAGYRRRESAEELTSSLGVRGVEVRWAGDVLVLAGEVSQVSERTAAEKIAAASGKQVINLIRVPQEDTLVSSFPDPADIEREIGLPGVKLRMVGNALVLEGTVDLLAQVKAAEDLASQFAPKVVNLLQVRQEGQMYPDSATITRQIAIQGVSVRRAGGVLVLEGGVAAKEEALVAEAVAGQYGLRVASLLRVAPPVPIQAHPETATGAGRVEALEIEEEIGLPGVRVRTVRDLAVLEGHVNSESRKLVAEQIASQYAPRVVNAIVVDEDPIKAAAAEAVRALVAEERVEVSHANGVLILQGEVETPAQRERAEKMASIYFSRVLNLLRVDALSPRATLGAQTGSLGPGGTPEGSADSGVDGEDGELAAVNMELKSKGAQLRRLGRRLLLDGEVGDEKDLETVRRIAQGFYPSAIDAVKVRQGPAPGSPSRNPKGPDLQAVKEALGIPAVRLRFAAGTLVMEGKVPTQRDAEVARKLAELFWTPVMSLLEVQPVSRQVQLKMKFIEINRSELGELGADWPGDLGFLEEKPGDGFWVGRISRADLVEARLRLLQGQGVVQFLAEPNLVAIVGRQASFLAGGQIPVPGSEGAENGVEWRDYGIKLSFLPEALDDGGLVLRIKPEVSSLDWDNAVKIGSSTVPALKTRQVESVARIAPGSTLALGGLLQSEETVKVQKVPLLGDLPILGALFRSKSFQQKHTELVVLVTVTETDPAGGPGTPDPGGESEER